MVAKAYSNFIVEISSLVVSYMLFIGVDSSSKKYAQVCLQLNVFQGKMFFRRNLKIKLG